MRISRLVSIIAAAVAPLLLSSATTHAVTSTACIASAVKATSGDDTHDDQHSRDDDERPTNQPEQGETRGHQSGPVHQPPQDQAVPDADEKARSYPGPTT